MRRFHLCVSAGGNLLQFLLASHIDADQKTFQSKLQKKKLLQSSSLPTKKSYSSYTKQWYLFCQQRKINPLSPTREQLMEQVSQQTEKDASKTKAVLKWIVYQSVSHILDARDIEKLCNKCFSGKPDTKPPRLLHSHIWDPETILDFFKDRLKIEKKLTFMELSQKTAVLLLLAVGKRPSEIRDLSLTNYEKTNLRFMFILMNPTKTSTSIQERTIEIRRYPSSDPLLKAVCPYRCLVEYIKQSAPCRETQSLLITTTGGTAISAKTLAH